MMTHLLVAILLAAAAATEPSTTPATAPATQAATPVLALFREPGYPPPGVTPKWDLNIAVWADGTVCYAGPKQDAAYHKTKIDPARVEKLMKDLTDVGFFDDPEVNRQPYRVPVDGGATVMAGEWKGKRQRLGFWREIPNDRFGEVWKASQKLIWELKPQGGEPVTEIDRGVWGIGWKKKS